METLNHLVPKSPHLRVALGIVAVAAILGLVGKFLGATAKDILTVAAAIGGLSCIAVGLALSQDAFKLMYDRERKSRVRRRVVGATGDPEEVEEDTGAAVEKVSQDLAAAATLAGVTVDLNTLLPKLAIAHDGRRSVCRAGAARNSASWRRHFRYASAICCALSQWFGGPKWVTRAVPFLTRRITRQTESRHAALGPWYPSRNPIAASASSCEQRMLSCVSPSRIASACPPAGRPSPIQPPSRRPPPRSSNASTAWLGGEMSTSAATIRVRACSRLPPHEYPRSCHSP